MANEHLFLNGIDGATGDYLLPPQTVADVASAARGEVPDANHLRELKIKLRLATTKVLGVTEGVDPADLASAGCGAAPGGVPARRGSRYRHRARR